VTSIFPFFNFFSFSFRPLAPRQDGAILYRVKGAPKEKNPLISVIIRLWGVKKKKIEEGGGHATIKLHNLQSAVRCDAREGPRTIFTACV
jgi:hypothetical protein